MCGRLVGVWKVSGLCLVSGRCLGASEVPGGCFEGVWSKNPHIISTGRKGPMCLEIVCWVSERFPRGVWKGLGNCLEGAWKVFGG